MGRIDCLDKGYVDRLCYTPDGDLLVVNAARCSFDKEKIEFDDSDIKLLDYLAKHKHVLPFRHPNVTFRMHMPIFVARQSGKHQVGMSCSEVSRRYIKTEPEFHVPVKLRSVAANVKQGSTYNSVDEEEELLEDYNLNMDDSLSLYNRMLKEGVCPEQARILLPQSMYTTFVWTGTLLAWFHFWNLRSDSHAQKEIQEYAFAVGKLMSEIYPESWKALMRHA